MSELADLIDRHCRQPMTPTAIPGLMLSRACAATELSAAIYHPLLCVVARGRKRIILGREEFFYDRDCYLLASADLPVSGQVVEAPCLGLTFTLEPATVTALLLELPPTAGTRTALKAVAVNPLEGDLLDPLVRMLRLLDRPQEIPVLAPVIEREILYRLLCGPRGETLRQMALPGSRFSQVSRAIGLIRRRYREKIPVAELALAAGMSATSFHRHFRAVTAMSPLQFQKRIRLQEARRLMLSREVDANRVGFDVGYESASQFSREYRRWFGTPPARDAAEARRALGSRREELAAPAVGPR